MYLLVGLGNIGKEYENTRHNFGFICVDEIIERYNIGNHEVKFNADIYRGNIGEYSVMVAKPRTYMNRSGVAVAQIKNFYKIFLENIFVFHDDLDLDFCRIKLKCGGGAGGHNGLKSISENIGKNYNRVRLGISRPENKNDVINYVLRKFNSEELKKIRELNDDICYYITELFSSNKNNFLNRIYQK